MKAFSIAIMLGIALFSCNGGVATQGGLDWNFYKKKSDGATVKVLCTIQDLNEFNYLKTYLKPFLKDSFGINVLIYYVPKDRIVKTLLDDSKRNSKVVYDLVIADPDIMQSLFTLGLLYGKYLNTLPNNRYLDYSFINALKPYTELRDYVIPYACNQYVLLYDSCDIPNGGQISSSDISQISLLKDENYIYSLFYLYRKSGIGDLAFNKSNKDKIKEQKDSILLALRSRAITTKDLIKHFKNDVLQQGVLRNSQGKFIISNNRLPDLKISYLENDFPVYYKMAAITNTSVNVIAAMVTLNELISKKFQMNKFVKTFDDDLPVLNLDLEHNNSNTDSTLNHIEFNKLTRSKLIFSIADIREANAWWKEGSKK
jgi:spermidine/putrescine-binding protein